LLEKTVAEFDYTPILCTKSYRLIVQARIAQKKCFMTS